MGGESLVEGDKCQLATDTVIYLITIMVSGSKRGLERGLNLSLESERQLGWALFRK